MLKPDATDAEALALLADLQHKTGYQARWLCYLACTGQAGAAVISTASSWQYIVWIMERWSEWSALYGKPDTNYSPEEHDKFDAWLARKCYTK